MKYRISTTMATEYKKYQFPDECKGSFFNKCKVKFLQIKKDTIRQKCCQKHKKTFEKLIISMKR